MWPLAEAVGTEPGVMPRASVLPALTLSSDGRDIMSRPQSELGRSIPNVQKLHGSYRRAEEEFM